jgi:single-strand DNA-binding protein
MADNSITLTGNITRDPEMRFSNGGMAITSFSLAVNSRKKGKNGEYEDDPNFFDITCFGDLAEHVAESLSKGARAIVTGRLDWSSWDDKETGQKRSKVQVIADGVGPDLRWATAVVTRSQSNSNSRGQQDDTW